ncbi:MAG TPA: DUF1326 domain-containing protein [Actinomycetota bacterium]|nr:DUF1326 domain-containing protein [Actinomycetota bacterium]
MATTKEEVRGTQAAYRLEGTLLEVCSCDAVCPCWIGEDPDGGECYGIVAYHVSKGSIEGVDVSGLNLVNINHIPGNILTPGSWRVVMVLDAAGSQAQRDALVRAFSGELGGPLADLAGLVGEVRGIETLPITHETSGGRGILRIEGVLEAEMAQYSGPDGSTTVLQNSIFSTVPGSPAYVAKASRNRLSFPKYGMEWEYEGRNAIQSDWAMEHVA